MSARAGALIAMGLLLAAGRCSHGNDAPANDTANAAVNDAAADNAMPNAADNAADDAMTNAVAPPYRPHPLGSSPSEPPPAKPTKPN